MAEVIKMPRLSDTMTDGVVAKWHKKVGDNIQEGDLLADIETDKATMEFESFQEGTLLYIGVKENETAQVDAILAILGDKNEDISDLLNSESVPQADTNNNIEDNNNQDVKVEEIVTDKSLSKIDKSSDRPIKISPLAKRIAKEKNLNISSIQGTGDGGRIIKRDVDSSSNQDIELSHQIKTSLSAKEVPVSQMRKTIADRLSESKFTAPHFYLNMEVEMDSLIENRKIINQNILTLILHGLVHILSFITTLILVLRLQ